MKHKEKRSVNPQKHPAETELSDRIVRRNWSLLVFFLSLLLYSCSLNNSYNLDDYLVTNNHRLTSQGLSAIPEIFSSPYYQDDMGYSYEYRPLVLVSFAIEHACWGENPGLSHLLNGLLYAASCSLLFLVLVTCFFHRHLILPAIISLLFAATPIHTEVVCSIKNRDEILSLLFGLLTLYSSILFLSGNKRMLFPALLFYTGALMSKVSAVAFALISPCLSLLFIAVPFSRFLGLTLCFSVITHFFITNTGSALNHFIASFAVSIIPLFFFLLKNYALGYSWIKKLLADSLNRVNTDFTLTTYSKIDLSVVFSEVKSISLFTVLLPAAFSLITFVFFIETKQYNLAAGCIGLLFFPLFFLRNSLSLIALLSMFCSFLYFNFSQNYHAAWEYHTFLTLFLLFSFFRKHRFPATFWLLGISMGIMETSGVVDLNILFVFYLLAFFYREKKPVRIMLYAIASLSLIGLFGFYDLHNALMSLSNFVLVFLAVLVFDVRRGKYIMPLLLIIFVGFFCFDIVWSEHYRPVTQKAATNTYRLKQTMDNLTNNLLVQPLIPAGTDRPLGFTEQVIQPNDIWQVKTGTSAAILLKYLQKVIIPYPLACYYGFSEIEPTHITEPKAVAGFLLYLLLALLTLYGWFRDKILAAGLLIYLLSIAFFANLFAPVPGMFAERFLLIPSLGFCIVLVWLLGKVFRADFTNISSWKDIPRGFQFSFVLILSLYSITTVARSLDWKNQLTLFSRDIQHVPRSANMHNLLGLELMKIATENPSPVAAADQQQQAKFHFQQAISIYPDYFNALYDLGRIYRLEQKPDSALLFFEHAAALPNQFPPLYLNLAEVAQQTGDTTKLLPCFEKLHELEPANPQYLQYAYQILIGRKDFAAALQKARKAQQLTPDAPPVWMALGFAFKNLNQPDSALFYYQKHYAATGDGKSAAIINELQNTP